MSEKLIAAEGNNILDGGTDPMAVWMQFYPTISVIVSRIDVLWRSGHNGNNNRVWLDNGFTDYLASHDNFWDVSDSPVDIWRTIVSGTSLTLLGGAAYTFGYTATDAPFAGGFNTIYRNDVSVNPTLNIDEDNLTLYAKPDDGAGVVSWNAQTLPFRFYGTEVSAWETFAI